MRLLYCLSPTKLGRLWPQACRDCLSSCPAEGTFNDDPVMGFSRACCEESSLRYHRRGDLAVAPFARAQSPIPRLSASSRRQYCYTSAPTPALGSTISLGPWQRRGARAVSPPPPPPPPSIDALHFAHGHARSCRVRRVSPRDPRRRETQSQTETVARACRPSIKPPRRDWQVQYRRPLAAAHRALHAGRTSMTHATVTPASASRAVPRAPRAPALGIASAGLASARAAQGQGRAKRSGFD